MINRITVLEEVGKISDSIKFADDPAGEVKKNITQIKISKWINSSIYYDKINKIPDKESKFLIKKLHVMSSNIFLPILSNSGPTINVLKKLDRDKGSIYLLIYDCVKWNLFYKVAGNL